MKKIGSFLLCALLLLTMAASAAAEETDSTTATEGHVHSWTETDSATCDQAGSIVKTCSCGVSETVDSPAKGHSWTETVTKAATCTSDGSMTKTCSRCNATQTVVLDRLSASQTHTWGDETVTKKPTCQESGSKKRVCRICGDEEVTVLSKLTTHTYDSACDAECNVCGEKRTVSHTFTTTWSKDYNGHWHECTKCGEKKDESKHTPGDAATETTDQVCTVCSYVIAARKPHTHSYGSEWTSDDLGHWHACTTCDEEKDYAAHKYDDDCDGECNTCGYKRENTHTYDETQWQTSKFEHWNVCTVCGETSQKEKHVPGEEATDQAPQLCTVCNFELAPMLEHSHDFGNAWHQDKQTHWQECSCGELSVPAVHVWDSGRENRNGTATFTCTICGAEKTDASEKSGFNWIIIPLVMLALGCLGGIGFLVYKLRSGDYDGYDQELEEEDMPEEELVPAEDLPQMTREQEEEKMIDDYFASLDLDSYK